MFRKQQKWSPPGQPAYTWACKPMAKRGSALGSATAPNEVNHQRNHRYDQQEVNQPTRNVEGEKSQQPQYEQNRKQRYKH
jgi:hypothetical protein